MRALRRSLLFGGIVASVLIGCSLVTNLDGLTGGTGTADARPVEAALDTARDPGVKDAAPDHEAVPTCDAGMVDPRYLNDVVEISVGDGFACAVRSSGTVVCWGANNGAELGTVPDRDADDTLSTRPVTVPLSTKALHVAAGFSHACMIDEKTNVWCWGRAEYLGAGRLDASTSKPVMVIDNTGAPLSGVTAVGVGISHTCAIAGGSVACWGTSDYGQVGPLGINTITDHAVLVPGLGAATALAVGQQHTCTLRNTVPPEIDCWGLGANGQLGVVPDGSPNWHVVTPIPLDISGSGASVPIKVAAGYRNTCVLDNRGNVYATGDNLDGELGALSVGAQVNNVTAIQGLTDLLTTSIASGDDHSCAVRADRTAVCIGNNQAGELGRGTYGEKQTTPAAVIGLGWIPGQDAGVLQDVVAVAVGGIALQSVSCALIRPVCANAGSVACWGNNGGGELGIGTISDIEPPTRVVVP